MASKSTLGSFRRSVLFYLEKSRFWTMAILADEIFQIQWSGCHLCCCIQHHKRFIAGLHKIDLLYVALGKEEKDKISYPQLNKGKDLTNIGKENILEIRVKNN